MNDLIDAQYKEQADDSTSAAVTLTDIQSKPVGISSKTNENRLTIKIDQAVLEKNKIVVSGWSSDLNINMRVVTSNEIIATETKMIDRPDVNATTLNNSKVGATGFEIIGSLTPSTAHSKLYLTFNFDGSLHIAPLQVKRETSTSEDIHELKLTTSSKSKAHIDLCGAVPGKFGILSGWGISKPGVTLWLVDSHGNRKNLSTTLRFHRDDIGKVFNDEYSVQTVYAGFVSDWPFPQKAGDSIAVVEEYNATFKIVATSKWSIIADDPVSYAKFAFSVPTPAQDFNLRLNSWEGDAISSLIADRNSMANLTEMPPLIWHFGNIEDHKITYSVIIPLYGRWDFLEHQLSEFSKDKAFNNDAEIIYVIDDPLLITPLINEAENLLNLYGVPFTIIWGHRNRGFSGANNLGVQHANGEFLILLNSDVFPTRSGWVEQLCSTLIQNQDFGMIGAKLLFPDGGLQHGGMTFLYSQSWSVWLNKHPLAGLDPNLEKSTSLVEKPAVTGACLAMRKAQYKALGGFDEGYLIGDFEDSDLCMKVRAAGLKIGYLPTVVLTHLERQSFSLLGDSSFRTLVVRFNAWRHSKRWGPAISDIMKKFEGTANE